MNERVCCICGSKDTYIRKCGIPDWANLDGKPCCKSCLMKIKWNKTYMKKWNPINIIRNSKKNIKFKGKNVWLGKNPRIGFCNLCKKHVGDEYINSLGNKTVIKRTAMHHINYHEDDILKDTIELCQSCHMKITQKKIDIMIVI